MLCPPHLRKLRIRSTRGPSRSDSKTCGNGNIRAGVLSRISMGAYCGYDVRSSLDGSGDSVASRSSLLPVGGLLFRSAAWCPKSDVEVGLSGQTGSREGGDDGDRKSVV